MQGRVSAKPSKHRAVAIAVAGMVAAVVGAGQLAWAQDGAPVAPEFRLAGSTGLPVLGYTPEGGLRGAPEYFLRLPSSFRVDSLSGLDTDAVNGPLDQARATVRYSWLLSPNWAMRIGLSTRLESDSSWQRLLAGADRSHGPLPLMHLSGQSMISERWFFSLDADGQAWGRGGQSLDMDLRVDYHLSPSLALFGSYRLSDNYGEPGEFAPLPFSNSARFGLRLQF